MKPTFYVKISKEGVIVEFEQSKNHWTLLPIKTQDQETATALLRSIIAFNEPGNYCTIRNTENKRSFALRCPNGKFLCESTEFRSYRAEANAGRNFSIAVTKAKYILDEFTRREFKI